LNHAIFQLIETKGTAIASAMQVESRRTQTPRELHGISTAARALGPYSEFVMRGAFVVQLWTAAEGDQLAGSVEEVDTGKQARFHCDSELIAFLRGRVARPHIRQQQEGNE
jgi:hypothetical protein